MAQQIKPVAFNVTDDSDNLYSIIATLDTDYDGHHAPDVTVNAAYINGVAIHTHQIYDLECGRKAENALYWRIVNALCDHMNPDNALPTAEFPAQEPTRESERALRALVADCINAKNVDFTTIGFVAPVVTSLRVAASNIPAVKKRYALRILDRVADSDVQVFEQIAL